MKSPTHITEPSFFIQGPCGNLELALHLPESEHKAQPKTVGIVCHPHPLYDGTMHNKVVTTTAKTFTALGLAAIRFNYRGVGASAGQYAEGIGESEDLKAVIAWALERFPNSQLVLAGFSFGTHVSARISSQVKPLALISIAPPINHFNFDEIKAPTCPWLVIHGENDELVPFKEVQQWLSTHKNIDFNSIPDASHFFHGKLLQLRESINTWLNPILGFE